MIWNIVVVSSGLLLLQLRWWLLRRLRCLSFSVDMVNLVTTTIPTDWVTAQVTVVTSTTSTPYYFGTSADGVA